VWDADFEVDGMKVQNARHRGRSLTGDYKLGRLWSERAKKVFTAKFGVSPFAPQIEHLAAYNPNPSKKLRGTFCSHTRLDTWVAKIVRNLKPQPTSEQAVKNPRCTRVLRPYSRDSRTKRWRNLKTVSGE
jgi:hypothetical protein